MRVGVAVALVAVLSGATAATGQGVPTDSVGLFGKDDLVLAGSLLAAQVALFAFDDEIHSLAARMRSEATNDVAGAFRPLGRRRPWYYASAAAYAVGLVVGERRIADLGLHAFLSIAVANAVTGSLKGLGGRFRPVVLEGDGSSGQWVVRDPDEWGFLAGLREGGARQSWPSGHTTAAFAVAAALSEELGGVVPWVAYPVATGVAWSRVNDEAHWATDVIMGALVGTFAARLVVRHGHRRGSWIERTLLLEPDPYARGLSVAVRAAVP
jgi:membrane-associated phospholipid phosphatase